MKSKLRFITIGYMEKRKGQDVLIEAIKLLPHEIAQECEFLILGQDGGTFAQKLQTQCSGMEGVTLQGTVPRAEIHKKLRESDVMICPSREDPMPTVCAEAMMHHVPCLVSDAAGTAKYIRHTYNGMVFPSENTEALRDGIIWCVTHRDALKDMGDRAYELYKTYFSAKVFENNLLRIIEEMTDGK